VLLTSPTLIATAAPIPTPLALLPLPLPLPLALLPLVPLLLLVPLLPTTADPSAVALTVSCAVELTVTAPPALTVGAELPEAATIEAEVFVWVTFTATAAATSTVVEPLEEPFDTEALGTLPEPLLRALRPEATELPAPSCPLI